jgi:hypothetical protein
MIRDTVEGISRGSVEGIRREGVEGFIRPKEFLLKETLLKAFLVKGSR